MLITRIILLLQGGGGNWKSVCNIVESREESERDRERMLFATLTLLFVAAAAKRTKSFQHSR